MAIVEDVGQLATKHRLKLHRAAAQLATATLLLTDPAKRADGLAALRRAQRTYESLQAAWGMTRCLLLAKAYGVRVDESRTRDLVRGRFPIEAAELGLVERGRPPQAPLSYPGG